MNRSFPDAQERSISSKTENAGAIAGCEGVEPSIQV